jgi:hypothetical protein
MQIWETHARCHTRAAGASHHPVSPSWLALRHDAMPQKATAMQDSCSIHRAFKQVPVHGNTAACAALWKPGAESYDSPEYIPPHEGKRVLTKSTPWAHTWIHCGLPVRGGILPAGKQAVQAHNTEEQVV